MSTYEEGFSALKLKGNFRKYISKSSFQKLFKVQSNHNEKNKLSAYN